jgi:hypothetical protein
VSNRLPLSDHRRHHTVVLSMRRGRSLSRAGRLSRLQDHAAHAGPLDPQRRDQAIQDLQGDTDGKGSVPLLVRGSAPDSGRIRKAIAALRHASDAEWRSDWLVSDGDRIYRITTPNVLETLSGRTPGQLAFAVVALGPTREALVHEIKGERTVDTSRFRGDLYRFGNRKTG